jgi:hypothetical protein
MGTGTNIRFNNDQTVRSFENSLLQYIMGSFLFAVVMGIVAGIVSFIIVSILREKSAGG